MTMVMIINDDGDDFNDDGGDDFYSLYSGC